MKKIISAFLSIVMVVLMIPVVGVSAETEGSFTYTINNGEVTIKDFYAQAGGDVVIPDTLGGYPVTSIGECAFELCSRITSITIPESVTRIGGWAFSECTSLTNINMPDSITNIGMYAFSNTGYYNDSSNWENNILYIGNYLVSANTSVSNYEIKPGTTLIADYAFYNHYIKSIILPESLNFIGYKAFCDDRNVVEDVTPNQSLKWPYLSGKSIFYSGNEESWQNISIDESNEYLLNFNYIHYNVVDAYSHFTYETRTPCCISKVTGIYSCSCGFSIEETSNTLALPFDQLHSNTVLLNNSKKTCTSDGYTGDTYCNDCQKTVRYGDVIPASHNITQHSAKSPTCTESGWFAYETCEDCDYTTYVELRKYGHSYENGTCVNCGEAESKTVLYGDATDDGKINLADVSLMLKYIAKWNVELDTAAADVTCDGKVNLADVSLILKYIAKWDVVLGK